MRPFTPKIPSLAVMLLLSIFLTGCGQDCDQRVAQVTQELRRDHREEMRRLREEQGRTLQEHEKALTARLAALERDNASLTMEISGYNKLNTINDLVNGQPDRMARASASSFATERLAYIVVILFMAAVIVVRLWRQGEQREARLNQLAELAASESIQRNPR